MGLEGSMGATDCRFTRSIRGWHLDRTMEKSLTIRALNKGLMQSVPGIHHSDQGVQYASNDYVRILEENEIAISMAWFKIDCLWVTLPSSIETWTELYALKHRFSALIPALPAFETCPISALIQPAAAKTASADRSSSGKMPETSCSPATKRRI